jgi:hypothetical protein
VKEKQTQNPEDDKRDGHEIVEPIVGLDNYQGGSKEDEDGKEGGKGAGKELFGKEKEEDSAGESKDDAGEAEVKN